MCIVGTTRRHNIVRRQYRYCQIARCEFSKSTVTSPQLVRRYILSFTRTSSARDVF
jgi:hypothetical protein